MHYPPKVGEPGKRERDCLEECDMFDKSLSTFWRHVAPSSSGQKTAVRNPDLVNYLTFIFPLFPQALSYTNIFLFHFINYPSNKFPPYVCCLLSSENKEFKGINKSRTEENVSPLTVCWTGSVGKLN